MTTTATHKKFRKNEYDPATLKKVMEYDNFWLARKPDGQMGIFSITLNQWDWDTMNAKWPEIESWQNGEAEWIPLAKPYKVATQLDDDCAHLVEPEWYGLFETRCISFQMEAASWA